MFAEMMVIIPEVRMGAGRHYQYIKPESNIVTGLHLNFVTQPLCLVALCLTKVSVGLFLLRMTPSKRYSQFIWATIIFTILSSTGNFCMQLFLLETLASTNMVSDRLLPVQASGLYLGHLHSRGQLYPADPSQVRCLLQFE